MSVSSPPPSTMVNVKSMISIFENQTFAVNDEPARLVRRAKSVGSLNTTAIKKYSERIEPKKNQELAQIEQQIQHLQRTLSNYKTYSRETHIYYQNQIFFLLTDLANVETKNKPAILNKKSELTELLKRINSGLISRLPSKSKKSKTEFTPTKIVKSSSTEKKEPLKKLVVQKRESVDEEEPDTPAPSVKSLKQLFEKNAGDNETAKEVVTTKITRKFLTFNGSSDTKYIPFSERFKLKGTNTNTQVFLNTLPIPQTPLDLYENSVQSKEPSFDREDVYMNGDDKHEMSEHASSNSDSGEDSDESSNGGKI
ncbi:hypothetical protein BDFB_002536 [Asbolus verrucosus]|uniref:Uncharacterized protein n=1 Tax=Asbolus verrucosus TaxID=1661398 RepID=A0A482VLQ9_ASBVE|nr:hypothetical protein BDFB_002536 [Asbolus verrucosus]